MQIDTDFLPFAQNFEQMQTDVASEIESAKRHIHTLKGVAANLAATALYQLCASIDATLKQNRLPTHLERMRLNALLRTTSDAICAYCIDHRLR